MKSNLKQIRERLGLSQSELADAVGVSQGNISHCEQQLQEVTPALARNLIECAKKRGITITFDDIYSVGRRTSARQRTNSDRRKGS